MIVRVMKFAKFCSEYKVKPMMIERILSLEDYLVATPIDAMVKMTFKKKVILEPYIKGLQGSSKKVIRKRR